MKPEGWKPWEEYQAGLPKKRMGAAVAIRDEDGKWLIVKPSYRDEWCLPGGVVDINESPMMTAKREVREETGLNLMVIILLVANYNSSEGNRDENIQWFFDGGVVTENQKTEISIDGDEIMEAKFVDDGEFYELCGERWGHKLELIKQALKTGAMYTENYEKIV